MVGMPWKTSNWELLHLKFRERNRGLVRPLEQWLDSTEGHWCLPWSSGVECWKHHRDREWLHWKSIRIPIPLLILLVLGPPWKERKECQQYVSDASTSIPRNALPETEKYRVNALFVQFYGGLFQDILPILPVNPDLSSTSRLHPAVGLMEFERRKVLKETNTCVFLGVLGSVAFLLFHHHGWYS